MLFREIIDTLVRADVRFVLIGGVALVLRGSSRLTVVLDVCYARDADNLARLAAALAPLHPRLRGAPENLPFFWDARTLRSGLNFTLKTDLGDVDLLGEVTGLGGYESVASLATEQEVAGLRIDVLSLEGLERAKRAAGRVKDLLDLEEIAELKRQANRK
jgi:hypothetical protein